MSLGVEKGWNMLSGLAPEVVCREAGAFHDPEKGMYILNSFGMDLFVSPQEQRIFSRAPGSDLLLKDLQEHSLLSVLWYLAHARDIPLSGQLVRPDNMKGGHLFSKGTHVLPLDRIANTFGGHPDKFLEKGMTLGASKAEYGDMSIRLLPFPRIPVTLLLWEGDDEFPPRADLLYDSTSEYQAPIDILWSIAMMSVLIML